MIHINMALRCSPMYWIDRRSVSSYWISSLFRTPREHETCSGKMQVNKAKSHRFNPQKQKSSKKKSSRCLHLEPCETPDMRRKVWSTKIQFHIISPTSLHFWRVSPTKLSQWHGWIKSGMPRIPAAIWENWGRAQMSPSSFDPYVASQAVTELLYDTWRPQSTWYLKVKEKKCHPSDGTCWI